MKWKPLRAGGRLRFVWFLCFRSVLIFYFICFLTSGMFSGSEALKHEIYFQTLAHERSGLSYFSSGMLYISSWISWRLQARCTIPHFFFISKLYTWNQAVLVFYLTVILSATIIGIWIKWNRNPFPPSRNLTEVCWTGLLWWRLYQNGFVGQVKFPGGGTKVDNHGKRLLHTF